MIRKILDNFFIGILATLCFSACSQSPKLGPLGGPIELEGFQPFPSVRSFDAPGRIYRVDSEGHVFGVKRLNVKPEVGREIIPKVEEKAEFSLEQVLETIGLNPANISGDLRNMLMKKQEYVTESVDGEREFIDDDQVDYLLEKAFQNLRIRKDNKYYVIRETIRSKTLNYKSDKSWVVDSGIEADLKKLVQGKAKLMWSDGKNFSLKKSFEEPMRIWYKPERVLIEAGRSAETAPSIKTVPVQSGVFKIPDKVEELQP